MASTPVDARPNPEVSKVLLEVAQAKMLFATTELSHWVRRAVNVKMTGEIIVSMNCLDGRFGKPKIDIRYFEPKEES